MPGQILYQAANNVDGELINVGARAGLVVTDDGEIVRRCSGELWPQTESRKAVSRGK